jgi:hypothetical protein
MLTYLDLELLYKNRNVPGRFRLVDYTSHEFVSGNSVEAAGQTSQNLPQPSTGFCRLWIALASSISTAVVTDRVQFRFMGTDPNVTIPLAQGFPNATPAFAFIGGGSVQYAAGGPIWKTMDPLLVSDQDLLNVIWILTALSGQTTAVRGRYIDLPC